MSDSRVFVWDANPDDLRGRESQMRQAGVVAEAAVMTTCSRNRLLAALRRDAENPPRETSVSLVDCRTDRDDLEQVGFRVVETIRRHPSLGRVTTPVIWIDRLSSANVAYAARAGAAAVLDDDWVDRTDARELLEVIRQVSLRKPSPLRSAEAQAPAVYSDRAADSVLEEEERDRQFKRRFGYSPRPVDYELLWGLADAIEIKFLKQYMLDMGIASTKKSIERRLEKLQAGLRGQRDFLDTAEPGNSELARQFLAAVPAGPSPLADLAWPDLEKTRETIAERPEVTRLAFAVDDELLLAKRFLTLLDTSSRKIADRHRAIDEAVDKVSGALPLTAAKVRIQRVCRAVDDAYDDYLAHDFPEEGGIRPLSEPEATLDAPPNADP